MKIYNQDVRAKIKKSGCKMYQIAHECGINPSTLSVWLRYEMTPDQKKLIDIALFNLAEG